MPHPTREVLAWHGSQHDIAGMPSLDCARSTAERAVFFTDDADEAQEWSGSYLYEAHLDVSGFRTVNFPDVADPDGLLAEEDRAHLYDSGCMACIIADALASCLPGVVVQNVQNHEGGRVTTTYAVLDPVAILSFKHTHPEGYELPEPGGFLPS